MTNYKRKFKSCQWCKSKNVRYASSKETGIYRKCVECGMKVIK